MKFVLNTVTNCSGRLGRLGGLERLPSLALETPGVIFHTKGGSIPHLSKEAMQKLSPEVSMFLQLSITNTLHMHDAVKASQSTIAEFIAQKDSATVLLLRDPGEAQVAGFPEKGSIPLFTRSGRRNITVEEYMTIVESFRPDVYVPLYDADTDAASSKKREQKSLDRTEKLVEQSLQWHRKSEVLQSASIIAPVVGGYNEKLREKCVQFLRATESEFGGYLIDGLHMHGLSVAPINGTVAMPIIKSVCVQLPEGKVRFCFGPYEPRLVLEMIMAGVDVFDSTYVFLKATKEHRALVFSFDITEAAEDHITELDMTDSSWQENFAPLLPGCNCHTCEKFSKAYLYHLLNTREMLGPILLMIHNIHHYINFFKTIRHHVGNDTLPELLDHLNRQQSLPPYEALKKEGTQHSNAEPKDSMLPIDEEELSKKQRT